MAASRSGAYISQIKHVGGRVFERLLAEARIDAFNGPQGKILDALWQQDGLSARELGERTGLAGSTLTGMLDRMEAADLVSRVRSGEDRRMIRVFLTREARALRADYDVVSERMTDIYFQGFRPQEITAFEGYLLRVLDNVKAALASEEICAPGRGDRKKQEGKA